MLAAGAELVPMGIKSSVQAFHMNGRPKFASHRVHQQQTRSGAEEWGLETGIPISDVHATNGACTIKLFIPDQPF